MGRKYASIHVLDVPLVYTEQEIRKCYGKGRLAPQEAVERFIEQYVKMSKALGDEDEYPPQALIDHERRFAEGEYGKLQVVRSNHFWSIFDEDLSLGTVINKTRELSKEFGSPVVYTSNFDDSVFVMGVYMQGRCRTKLATGEQLTEYGIKRANLNLKAFFECFDFVDKIKSQLLRKVSDVSDAEELVSDVLEIPLCNHHGTKKP